MPRQIVHDGRRRAPGERLAVRHLPHHNPLVRPRAGHVQSVGRELDDVHVRIVAIDEVANGLPVEALEQNNVPVATWDGEVPAAVRVPVHAAAHGRLGVNLRHSEAQSRVMGKTAGVCANVDTAGHGVLINYKPPNGSSRATLPLLCPALAPYLHPATLIQPHPRCYGLAGFLLPASCLQHPHVHHAVLLHPSQVLAQGIEAQAAGAALDLRKKRISGAHSRLQVTLHSDTP